MINALLLLGVTLVQWGWTMGSISQAAIQNIALKTRQNVVLVALTALFKGVLLYNLGWFSLFGWPQILWILGVVIILCVHYVPAIDDHQIRRNYLALGLTATIINAALITIYFWGGLTKVFFPL